MAEKARGVSAAVRRGVGGAAGETLKRTGSAARGATGAVSAATGARAVEDIGEQVQETAKGAAGAIESAAGGDEQRTVREELREIVRDAALEVLVPVARRATLQAARYAITRGPQMARDTVAPKLADTLGAAVEEAGGPREFAKGWLAWAAEARTGMLEKVGVGGESRPRPWRERRLPVEEAIDVVVPLETAYDRFTEFDEYAQVMSRGETVDERPNERIAWERTDGVEGTAVITFHRLSDRLTRVMVTYDHDPQSLLEKTTALFGTTRRGLTADLMRFKAFAEMSEEDTTAPEEEPQQRAGRPPGRSRPKARRAQAEDVEEDENAEEPEGEYEEQEEPSRAHGRPVRRRPAARPRPPQSRRG
jgi:hypothetical protein